MKANRIQKTLIAAVLASAAGVTSLPAQSADALINKLVQKGVLTEKEAKELLTESVQTNAVPAPSKFKIGDAIKSMTLYGDLRFRYEYRSAANAPGTGDNADAYYRERFRYALRLGIKGDLLDNFYYGLRVETSSNPRSPWNTFADDSTPTPTGKSSDGVYLGQAYLGWKPEDWFEMTVGRMPMPLYVTPMIWDSDINPEGVVEKFKWSLPHADLFASFGQFIYQDTNPDTAFPSSDTFLLAWQLGAEVQLAKDVKLKVAPVLYNYTGVGQPGSPSYTSLSATFVGEGNSGTNDTSSAFKARFNQAGLNDLTVIEVPAEINFKVGRYGARVFGDFAYNFEGSKRAEAAYTASQAGVSGSKPIDRAYTQDTKAYMLGVGFGNLGLVYGQTSKKNTWEVRTYFQHVEQYAADVNLLDSDFFEGRGNLQGLFAALAYSFTDNIIGTFRYGYAERINSHLGTGGSNNDLPLLNPIHNYHLFQFDLTLRF